MKDRQILYLEKLDKVISKILTVSQEFMRQQEVIYIILLSYFNKQKIFIRVFFRFLLLYLSERQGLQIYCYPAILILRFEKCTGKCINSSFYINI